MAPTVRSAPPWFVIVKTRAAELVPAVVAETPEPADERGLEALALELTEPDEIDAAVTPDGSRRHHAFAFLRRKG